MILVPIRPLLRKECVKLGRWPNNDEFCAITQKRESKMGSILIGAFCLCDGLLIGIMTNDGSYALPKTRVFMLTRFDYYRTWVTDQMGYWPRSTPTSQTPRPTTTEIVSIHDQTIIITLPPDEKPVTEINDESNKVWEFMIQMIKAITIAFIIMLFLGLLIRLIRKVYIKVRNKFEQCCSKCPKCLLKCFGSQCCHKNGHKPKKIHYRLVLPFYMIVMVVLMYLFEVAEKMRPLRRWKKIRMK